jgi:hypothetical protein
MQLQLQTAFSSAAGAMVAAERRLDRDVERISKDPFDVDALVDGTFAPVAVQANAGLVRACDQTRQSLIDTYAGAAPPRPARPGQALRATSRTAYASSTSPSLTSL